MERQELEPCDAVTTAEAVELNALVVIDVKPAVLSDSKQRLRMQKPGGGDEWLNGKGGHVVIQSGMNCLMPTDR